MTVHELIALLETYPDDLRVVVNGYEDGFDDLSRDSLKVVEITLNTGTESYVGEHGYWFPEIQGRNGRPKDIEVAKALVLHRSSF
ncbi:MAG: hypothetical protein OXI16_10020 [Chloroflexota bacterium]|nr:hypothetical protein [Chloroflexota bacterium]